MKRLESLSMPSWHYISHQLVSVFDTLVVCARNTICNGQSWHRIYIAENGKPQQSARYRTMAVLWLSWTRYYHNSWFQVTLEMGKVWRSHNWIHCWHCRMLQISDWKVHLFIQTTATYFQIELRRGIVLSHFAFLRNKSFISAMHNGGMSPGWSGTAPWWSHNFIHALTRHYWMTLSWFCVIQT